MDFLDTMANFFHKCVEDTLYYLWNDPYVQTAGLFLLDKYVHFVILLKNNEFIQFLLKTESQRKEPTEMNWYEKCHLSLLSNSKYDLCSRLFYLGNNTEYETLIFDSYAAFYHEFQDGYVDFMKKSDEISRQMVFKNFKDHCFIGKTNNKYLIRVWYPGHINTLDDSDETIDPLNTIQKLEPSKVGFIFMEYRHPRMSRPIEFNIPKEMMMNGNEILSPPFIYRLLLHQNLHFYFDLEYTIQIVDHNIESKVLNSKYYILLKSNDYTILPLQKI